MRFLICCALVGGMMAGCKSEHRAPSRAEFAAAGKECIMKSGGRDVLRVMVPSDAECAARDGALHMKSSSGYVDVWLVQGAKSVEDGAGRVPDQIKSEFKDFRPTSSSAMTVAGAPAKRIQGSGVEADDGDPGDADVIVFGVEGRVFVACTHGENLSAAARRWLGTVVESAQAPPAR